MRMLFLAAFLLVVLSACMHAKLTDWDKPGASLAGFNADSEDCQRAARNSGAVALARPAAYNRCMEARGYTRLF